MTGLATFKARIFAGKGLVAAVAGAIRIGRVIGHINAHGIALGSPSQGMTFLIAARGIAVARQPLMVAGAAFNAFVRGMVENDIHALGSARVQLYGLIQVFEIRGGGIRMGIGAKNKGGSANRKAQMTHISSGHT